MVLEGIGLGPAITPGKAMPIPTGR
jgi:hypothetical protein